MGIRIARAGLVALVSAAVVTAGASARTGSASFAFSARGVETSVPVNNVSTFSGAAIGTGGIAAWSATVPHDPLNSCGVTDITPGGSFSLTGTGRVRLSGPFTGGTVTAPAGFCSGGSVPCGNETFSVDGLLTINGSLSGEFVGSLDHYSTTILGRCVTYFATISASLSASP